MKKLAIAAVMLLGMVGVAQADGDAAAGKVKAAVCAACHGADGNGGANPLWPKQAGQHVEYIVKQLQDFKSGARKDPIMNGMAASLSDQDMLNVATYFNSQTRSIGSADPVKGAKGQAIFKGGIAEKGVAACMACHGPDGAGNPAAKYPSLAGQNAAYVAKTLKDFRSGTRANDPQKMMRDIAAKLNDAEIDELAEYVSGLH